MGGGGGAPRTGRAASDPSRHHRLLLLLLLGAAQLRRARQRHGEPRPQRHSLPRRPAAQSRAHARATFTPPASPAAPAPPSSRSLLPPVPVPVPAPPSPPPQLTRRCGSLPLRSRGGGRGEGGGHCAALWRAAQAQGGANLAAQSDRGARVGTNDLPR